MIPARIGSKRVPKKNLRLLNGKPLISYSIEAAIKSDVFSEIYINSDDNIFAEFAEKYNIKFYRRPDHLGSDSTNNDEFAHDFIENVQGDVLVQLLPTSPLISPEEIKNFVEEMIQNKYDSLVSVEDKQIACLYNNAPVNFKLLESHKSSQTMIPVKAYATVLMGWTYESFRENMQKYGFAYHGADGKIGYFTVKGFSTIDIDNEEDFYLAEIALRYINSNERFETVYYGDKTATEERIETKVIDILNRDGVKVNDFDSENQRVVNLPNLLKSQNSNTSWSKRLINSENNSATLISQLPGEGNRLHYHPNWNEWWFIVDGEWKWEIEGEEFIIKKGDIVYIEKNNWHRITAIGEKPAIRLAVSKEGVPHIYKEDVQE